MRKGDSPLGPAYEVQLEEADGHTVLRARSVQAPGQPRVTLTFPAAGGADLGPFKERVVRSLLSRQGRP